MRCIPFCSSVLFFTPFFQQVHGFAFTVTQPRQCEGLQFDWVGGTPPFTALVLVPFGIVRNVSIPAQSWNEQTQSGDFSYVLPLNQSQKVVFSMGDATGPTAGGVTDVNTVQASAQIPSPCDTSSPSLDFTFETNLPLSQCENYSFGQFGAAVQPISVLVTIPNGESFTLNAPRGDPYVWKANLTEGTNVMFTVKDAQNRVGGTSQLLTVGASDDSSCLSPVAVSESASPTLLPHPSTASSPHPALTSTPDVPSSGSGSRSQDNKTSNKTPIIIPVVIGGSVGLLAIAILIFFLVRRKRQRNITKPNDLHGSAVPGVPTSFSPPGLGQMQYRDQVPPAPYSAPYSVNPNVGTLSTSQSTGFSPVPMQITPAPYSAKRNVVAPTSRSNGIPPGQMQYYDQTARTPSFANPNIGAQQTSRNNGFPPGSSTLTSIGSGPNMSPSTAAAMQASVPTELSTGSMDTKANYSAMSYKPEATLPQKGERHLYFDPYAGNWSQQDYGLDRYADASSSSQKIDMESTSRSGAGTAFNTGASVWDGEATLPQTRKSLQTLSSLPTQPPRQLIVHTDIEDELPPMYSDLRDDISPLPSAAPTVPGNGR